MSEGQDDAPTRMEWKEAVRESDLPAPSKLLCFVLESRMSVKCPRPFPSVETLVRDTGLGRRTVQKHLAELTDQDDGGQFVRKGHRFDPAGRQTSNEYRLVLTGPEGRVQEVHPGVQEMHGRGRISCTGEGAGDAPEVERKKKKQEDTAESWAREEAWPVFLEELGGSGRQPSPLEDRLKKLSLLYSEQLAQEEHATAVFRRILKEVKASDHHMSNRDWQMPESLFRSDKRRERWTLKALENGRPGGQQRTTPRDLPDVLTGGP